MQPESGAGYKWHRHRSHARCLLSITFFIIGTVILICSTAILPQSILPDVFNSRLINELTIDQNDLLTEHWTYSDFVDDYPTSKHSVKKFYFLHVDNPQMIVERGFKPSLLEIGPFGYVKHSKKYDVQFGEANETSIVSYKEFSYLTTPDDKFHCLRLHNLLELSRYVDSDRDCGAGECFCKNPNNYQVTIVNPKYLKLVRDETSHKIVGLLSREAFTSIKALYIDEFPRAVLSFYVPLSLHSAYQYRKLFHIHKFISLAIDYSLEHLDMIDGETRAWNATISLFIGNGGGSGLLSPCGLDNYEIDSCKMSPSTYIDRKLPLFDISGNVSSDYFLVNPDIAMALLNQSNKYSFANASYGIHAWLMTCDLLGYLSGTVERNDIENEANSVLPITATLEQRELVYNDMVDYYESLMYGAEEAGERSVQMIDAVASWFASSWVQDMLAASDDVVYEEWSTGVLNNSVSHQYCDPAGNLCQFSLKSILGNISSDVQSVLLTRNVFDNLFTEDTATNKNKLHFFYPSNVASWYDTFAFCESRDDPNTATNCSSYEEISNTALLIQPSILWNLIAYTDSDVVSIATMTSRFDAINASMQSFMQQAVCNVSKAYFSSFLNATEYPRIFAASSINYQLSRSGDFDGFQFSMNNLDQELGYSQWGSGMVTQMIFGVPSIFNIIRKGMWRLGPSKLSVSLSEYYAWCLLSGYPSLRIVDPMESKMVLDSISDDWESGIKFRSQMIEKSTTFIGDGINFVNGVGNEGERAFTLQSRLANFSCTDSGDNVTCVVVDFPSLSSAVQCNTIENFYETCLEKIRIGDTWLEECEKWQTSVSNPGYGILCDNTTVFQRTHPSQLKRGNVVSDMIYYFTHYHVIRDNRLWCEDVDDCQYDRGGLFVTSTPQKILFDGILDPFTIKVMDEKYRQCNVSVHCVDTRVLDVDEDTCEQVMDRYTSCDSGVEISWVSTSGIAERVVLNSSTLSRRDFFAMTIKLNVTGSAISSSCIKCSDGECFMEIINPFIAVYPALDKEDDEFHKESSCQSQFLQGPANVFGDNDCVSTKTTGTTVTTRADSKPDIGRILKYHGNETLSHGDRKIELSFTNTTQQYLYDIERQVASSWSGFLDYSYQYKGSRNGIDFQSSPLIELVIGESMMHYSLKNEYAEPLAIRFFGYPYQVSNVLNFSVDVSVMVNRYYESKKDWLHANGMIGGSPHVLDSYGMEYDVPVGSTSLEWLAGFPVFLSTPHFYGNQLWGGEEYSQVNGLKADEFFHKTWVDVDPTSGKVIRRALRQQLDFRVERDSLLQSLFFSMGRCEVPTKRFSGGSGYGCFTYIPLMWWEDAKVMSRDDLRSYYSRYALRPERVYWVIIMGSVVSVVFFISSYFCFRSHKKRSDEFKTRVFVD